MIQDIKRKIDLKDKKIGEPDTIIGSELKYLHTNDPYKKRYYRCTKHYARYTVDQFLLEYRNHLRKVSTPIERAPPLPDDDEWGEYANNCRKYVGMLGWLEIHRPDISYAVNMLRRNLHRWDKKCDRQLIRLMSYIHYTTDYAVIHTVDTRDEGDFWIEHFSDADLGGCIDTKKSTLSSVSVIKGKHGTHVVLAHSAKRESCVSTGTPTSELNAAFTALKKTIMPLAGILEIIYGRAIKQHFFMDCLPAIKAIQNGYSHELRFISRSHGISLAFMHEHIHLDPNVELDHIESDLNIADIGTKVLEFPTFNRLCGYIGMLHTDGLELHHTTASVSLQVDPSAVPSYTPI
jgi:hypothetical protein